jgi:hypothetical protein
MLQRRSRRDLSRARREEQASDELSTTIALYRSMAMWFRLPEAEAALAEGESHHGVL